MSAVMRDSAVCIGSGGVGFVAGEVLLLMADLQNVLVLEHILEVRTK